MTAHPAHVDLPGTAVRDVLAAAGCTGASRGSAGRWTATTDGEPCTVTFWRRSALPDDGAFDERVRLLRGLDHAHLGVVSTVVEAGDEIAVVQRGAYGTPLADVLARRGALTPREVVTLVVPVAQALVVLHGAGLVHGPLDAHDVVVDDDGRAHLVPRVPPAPPHLVRHDDVRALAAMARAALDERPETGADPATVGGEESAAVATVLGEVLSPPPARPPTEAGTFAALAAEACPAEPIRVVDPGAAAAAALARAMATDRPRRRASRPGAGRPVTGEVRRPQAADGVRSVVAGTAPESGGDVGPLDDTIVRGVPLQLAVAPERAAGRPGAPLRPQGPQRHPTGGGAARRAGGRPGSSSHRASAPRRRTGPVVLGCAAAVVVGGLVAAYLVVGPRGASEAAGRERASASAVDGSPRPTASAVPAPDPRAAGVPDLGPTTERGDPAGAAAALTRARPGVVAGRVTAADVTAADSPARAADDALTHRVAGQGTFVTVPVADVRASRVVRATGRAGAGTVATVDVTYTLGAGVLRAADGSTVRVPGTALRTDRLDLVWTDDGWRVQDVG
ncbi:protein kinase [Luteimicrobium subarcticum]|uniref:Protein tyrosine kinase n=1 Tax=Luteimicrobium subarcticum TaxID=620910 RepID=A0A2M8WRD8_9MICO|nr:protein kinase [Luteimicrobium subarcticum]PJI93464.1 protein tyrosine kinase [Luteimicrobium subarcticum]